MKDVKLTKTKSGSKYILEIKREKDSTLKADGICFEYTAFWEVTVWDNRIDGIELKRIEFDDSLTNEFVYKYRSSVYSLERKCGGSSVYSTFAEVANENDTMVKGND